MNFQEILKRVEDQARTLVWWSPEQIARGEDIINDPKKGERAWSVPHATGQFLHDFIVREKPRIILELGTSIGYSTLWMADAARLIGSHVHTIENRSYKCDIAKKNISDAGLANGVTFHVGEISDVLKDFSRVLESQKIDFVFMDADRGHYHEYFPILEPYLSDHATIMADNAESHSKRMNPFFVKLNEQGWKYEILNFDNGILVAKKV